MDCDHWPVPDNIATRTAHQIMRDFMERRYEIAEKEWPEYLSCCKCSKKRGLKFPSETMLHVPVKSKKKERPYTYWRHYCEVCRKTYKPKSKRVGGRNY